MMEKKFTLETLATNIRKYRAVSRFSQEQLAELADLTQQYICTVENGRANPSVDVLMRIARALNVTANDLLY